MFERYTEKARRVIFFARYESSQFGASYIETEHLLLGLLREDKVLTNRFLRSLASVDIRKRIEGHTAVREKVSTSVDLPLSNESKRVLAYAAEEAERLSQKYIGPEHILLGLLREEKCFAAEILHGGGLRLSTIREELARSPHSKVRPPQRESTLLGEFSRDLTQAAMDSELDPLIGRNQELEAVIEILCNRNTKNAVLVGERGVGKTAIVEGLAQRIADGDVPSFLADKRIMALDLSLVVAGVKHGGQFEERLKIIVKELTESQNDIVFIDELSALAGSGSRGGSVDSGEIFKPALLRREIQCISTSIPGEYLRSVQTAPWLGRCFRTVNVVPLDKESTLLILKGRKEQYERFHAVTYTEEALECAAQHCVHYFPDNSLAKAMEVLDAAGARVKLRQTSLPEELTEVQKRIKFIVHRMENAIVNHEFEKARFYSDEERKERDNLRALREKYHLDESATGVVGREDIEGLLSSWAGVSISPITDEAAAAEENSMSLSAATKVSAGSQKGTTLRVFLCHASKDKPTVRDIYRQLKEHQIDPWLDEENLLPGEEWDQEIGNAVGSSHVVLVCLSAHSVNKSGYLQREIKKVLDVADEQPEGTIYVIPIKLEECEVPSRLRRWQWLNFFEPRGFEKLMKALAKRARELGLPQR
jgi:ATP-dependent Clp protease ATP-binding subunit ClpC